MTFLKGIKSKSTVNLGFRAITIFLKFILSIIVIKELSVDDYGLLGLFQSSIVILTFVLGFDFYNYSSRELISNAKNKFFILNNQLVFYFFSYLILIPLIILFSKIFGFFSEYLSLFVCILILEHLSQEIYRLLIILKKTIPATILLFLRSGVWILFLLGLIYFNKYITLNLLYFLWTIGAFMSVFYGIKFIKFKPSRQINLLWIKKGVKTSLPFFISTILFKLIEFSGRYFLDFTLKKIR